MIDVVNVRLQFGSRVLFDNVNLKFLSGNCYGIIGANGAGKSTFLKLLTGEIEPNKGEIIIEKNRRMSVLNQNQNAFDDKTIIETVLLGHKRLAEIEAQKAELYAKPDFSEADGILAGELEAEYADLGGWDAESEALKLLKSLEIDPSLNYTLMRDIDAKIKVKVLLAQALFMTPDILILDEPTNNLDFKTTRWLENFLLDFPNLVIIVSHNRHFLNQVTTHTCDVDFGKISMYVGNYDFWYKTSELLKKQASEQNKKAEERAKELKEFIARFSANASKSKQATSRKKELEKLEFVEYVPSNRKYPYIDFKPERPLGAEVLSVNKLTKKGYFENLTFVVNKEDKIAFFADNSRTLTMLFDILTGVELADSGSFRFGTTTSVGYLPVDNSRYFDGVDKNLVEWIGEYSKEKDATYLRSWLGRMLFSGEEALKKASVLSGGEKVRCMLARMMLIGGNVLILDEPTNHLDLESITSLNNGMVNFKGPMLFTSHDQEILSTVANRIIEIKNGIKVFDKATTFEDYLK